MLNYGVCGFWDARGSDPPVSDIAQFKKDCFTVSIKAGTKIREFDLNLLGRNFVTCSFEMDSKVIYCLLNAHYPLVAFAYSVEAFNIKFTDNKLLISELPEFYQVLSKEDLSSTISDEMLVNLNRVELEQVKYWNPQTVGELIFNHWD